MNNKEIIEDIKKHLTGINQVDIKYLNDQLKKYSKEKNDEVVYEIFTMIYKRLDPEALQKIHSQVESVQAKRIAEFTEAIKLYNNKEYAKSKEILLKLIDLFEKQFYMQKLNYYDFGEKIEGFIFCETPAKMDKMNIKFYPEPITRYLYYLAKIHHEENDDSLAAIDLEKSLAYNPRCIGNMMYLSIIYNNLNKNEEAFELLKEVLKYAYRKEQLASAYHLIGRYYQENQKYDIAIGCFLISNYYFENEDNYNAIMEITKVAGVIHFNGADDIVNTFKKYNLQHGVSERVIFTINDFIENSIDKMNYDTAEYLTKLAFELTNNNNKYKVQLMKIKALRGVKNETR